MRAAFTTFLVITMPWLAANDGCAQAEVCDDADRQAEAAAMYDEYRESFPDTPEITADELHQQLGSVVIVDRREAEERAASMIPGAITWEAFEANEQAYIGQTVVVYCTIGYRSGVYTEQLVVAGFDAYNLAVGILGWTYTGAELHDPNGQATVLVHVYGEEWDLVGCGYDSTW